MGYSKSLATCIIELPPYMTLGSEFDGGRQ